MFDSTRHGRARLPRTRMTLTPTGLRPGEVALVPAQELHVLDDGRVYISKIARLRTVRRDMGWDRDPPTDRCRVSRTATGALHLEVPPGVVFAASATLDDTMPEFFRGYIPFNSIELVGAGRTHCPTCAGTGWVEGTPEDTDA